MELYEPEFEGNSIKFDDIKNILAKIKQKSFSPILNSSL